MSIRRRCASWAGAVALVALSTGLAACGSDDEQGADTGATGTTAARQIERNPDNEQVTVTVGSKNFTEQFVLGEIYAQALEAAGYTVEKDLNLGSEQIALRGLTDGEIDGYPEYTSTALTSFFDVEADQVPKDAEQAAEQAESQLAEEDLTSFAPTPFTSANAVGMLKSRADELGVSKVSDLEGKAGELTLYGSPECRQRVDCLVGLQDGYGLEFQEFNPVDISQRYEVLDNGQADASIIFTTDAQLSQSDKYVTLEDDRNVFPPGNVLFVARQQTVDEAGEDFGSTIELVQGGLTEEVMQELNARVDVDKEEPAQVAEDYLRETGYIE